MNNSPLPKVLLAILGVIAVMSLWYCYGYFKNVREIRRNQTEITTVNYRQQVFSMLVNEAAEYSKRNPALEPILRSLNNPQTAPAAAAPAGAKPASK